MSNCDKSKIVEIISKLYKTTFLNSNWFYPILFYTYILYMFLSLHTSLETSPSTNWCNFIVYRLFVSSGFLYYNVDFFWVIGEKHTIILHYRCSLILTNLIFFYKSDKIKHKIRKWDELIFSETNIISFSWVYIVCFRHLLLLSLL